MAREIYKIQLTPLVEIEYAIDLVYGVYDSEFQIVIKNRVYSLIRLRRSTPHPLSRLSLTELVEINRLALLRNVISVLYRLVNEEDPIE